MMQKTRRFGLIGRNISYSFSKKYFEEKFRKLFIPDSSYEILDLPEIDDFQKILNSGGFSGLNVTIPYKQSVIPFLDELSEEAEKIGAVNCISFKNGIRKGHNTDAYGFEKTLKLHRRPEQNSAIILGNGGAAKAVAFVLDKNEIPHITVARKCGDFTFESLPNEEIEKRKIVINCTPVGTFPDVDSAPPFPSERLGSDHLAIDLIYNPETTLFLKNAAKGGAKTANGFYMLEQQAEKAWEIWNS